MKLKDLLVQELPKFGGWPDECVFAAYRDGFVHYYIDDHGLMRPKPFYLTRLAILPDDYIDAIVTREQYEEALTAAEKVEWDGKGLPPVGCKCQLILTAIGGDGDLGECEILFVGNEMLVWRQKSTFAEGSGLHRHMKFLPIRSESDKKRKETINLMDKRFKEVLAAGSTEAMAIFATVYDTILAGKIPSGHVE